MNETGTPAEPEEGEEAMEGAIERELAAETLRSVAGVRKRALASVRQSALPPLFFAVAALVAAPFGLYVNEMPMTIALGIAMIGALAATEVHYQRQPVHPAAPVPKQRTTADVIALVVLLVVFGPLLLGVLFSLLILPVVGGPGVTAFIGFTAAAILAGRRTRNDAIPIAGGFAMIAIAAGFFIWNDHWMFVCGMLYGGVFLLGAGITRVTQKRAA